MTAWQSQQGLRIIPTSGQTFIAQQGLVLRTGVVVAAVSSDSVGDPLLGRTRSFPTDALIRGYPLTDLRSTPFS
jgi:hypothetical protein